MSSENLSEPLAWTLIPNQSRINQQYQSPLFSRLPTEIRLFIFQYTLLAYSDPQRPYDPHLVYVRPGVTGRRIFATDLLLTCRRIYTEAYKFPFLMNHFEFYRTSGDCTPLDRAHHRFNKTLRAWQFAAVSKINVTVQQFCLEVSAIRSYNNSYSLFRNFLEYPFTSSLSHTQQTNSQGAGEQTPSCAEGSGINPLADCKIRSLSIHLGRTDWWTWENSPFEQSAYSQYQLALEPALGDGGLGNRPTPQRMKKLAEDRRNGRWKGWLKNTWGAQIAGYKDLTELELVLETFANKLEQLDTLVECAKTWRFPMDGWTYEDGGHSSNRRQSDAAQTSREAELAEAMKCWGSNPPQPFPTKWASELRFSHVVSSTWVGAADGYSYERSNPWAFGKKWEQRVSQHQAKVARMRNSTQARGDASEVREMFRQDILSTRRQMFHEDTQQSNIMTGGKWGMGEGVGPSKEEKELARTFVVKRVIFKRQKV